MHVNHAQTALDVLRAEACALEYLTSFERGEPEHARFVESLGAAAQILSRAQGVVVTGMGKSGHVARKVASTMTSLGKRAVFMHPGEAAHGDLGLISLGDAILAFSWSGQTAELAPVLKYWENGIVAVTSDRDSALARAAACVIELPKLPEACHNGQAPTVSTIMQMAVGDALAVAVSAHSGWTVDDFRRIHPGGALGHG